MTPNTIAVAAYAILAAYAVAIGEPEPKPWTELTDEQRQNYIEGVNYVLINPEAGPSAQHDMWLIAKQNDGWVHGEEKDEEKKTHPCILPFEELPEAQRAKDSIFRQVVLISKIWEDSEVKEPVVEKADKAAVNTGSVAPQNFTAIKYIGKRPFYVENTYGTGIKFNQGDTKLVPSDKAPLLLRHPDQYAAGEAAEVSGIADETPYRANNTETDTLEELQEARDQVAVMDVEALKTYVTTHFAGKKLHPNIGLEKARAQTTQLIDQFGLK